MATFDISRRNGDLYTVQVDDADLAAIEAAGPWFAHVQTHTAQGYRRHSTRTYYRIWRNVPGRRGTTESLSRFVLTLAGVDLAELYADHVNGDTLDNGRSNLRAVTKKQNAENVSAHGRSGSGFRGVCWEARRQKWRAQIHHTNTLPDGTRKRLCRARYFVDFVDACAWAVAERAKHYTHHNEDRSRVA
jgi:hypothetical protein